ncbi:transglycosylase SLT domain-containing protein [Stenotrophomonas forensis]|uniref:transglycosylase SLT domain-containing protein n=1 Tax=Stenotrophomonas forensis TaxID=2871169 RepID=UPI0018D334F8|nr:transglycosylase SLT domain-containing protein [Stenotrophomonas maltophilia]MBH1501889.1 transglycosylase SLT domain-containing protein [Stenotrophomonas maltophilia]MBH1785082.1 transglycosylase SLT domain-containing protein [Stenotrophomonas maltophilia]
MRLILAAGVVLAALLVLALAASPAQAQSRVAIPEASALYRHRVEQAVADVWGVNASPARLAAQLHQESGWRPKATSPVGAQGVAQFMPATAKWIAELFPDKLGQFDPWDAQQAILAAAIYDKWLLDRVQPLGWTRMSECTRWNFALRGYNGGEQWLLRDRGLAVANKADPNDWRSVERFRTRSVSNHQQNIDYPRRILLVLEPAYIAAGWPGTAVCS